MTEQEEIKIIMQKTCGEKTVQHHCSDSCLYGKDKCAFGMAITALEKQIPKKPDLEGDGYADGHLVYDTWICPNCGVKYEVDYEEYDWCPDCGQHIDWEK